MHILGVLYARGLRDSVAGLPTAFLPHLMPMMVELCTSSSNSTTSPSTGRHDSRPRFRS